MTELYRRILNPDISTAERDLLCEASFGKPFSEAVHEMRLDDLKEGVEARDYFILSVSSISFVADDKDENPFSFEICFTPTRLYDLNFLRTMAVLYEIDSSLIPVGFVNSPHRIEFRAMLYGTDTYAWAISEMRKLQQMV